MTMMERRVEATAKIQELFRRYTHGDLLTPAVLEDHINWAINVDPDLLSRTLDSENHPLGQNQLPYQPNLPGLKELANKLRGDDIQRTEYRPKEEKEEDNGCRFCANGDVYDFVWKISGKLNVARKWGEKIGFWGVESVGKCKECSDGDAVPGELLAPLLEKYPNLAAGPILLEFMLRQMCIIMDPSKTRQMSKETLKDTLLDLVKIPEKAPRIDSEPLSGVEPTPVSDEFPNAGVPDEKIPF